MQEEEDSDALKKTIRLINSLPDDVMRHIYEEYFVGIDTCNKYLKLLESDESHNLNYLPLLEPTRRLLEHPCAVEYLCSKHKVFKIMYVKHYINHNKSFLLMDMPHSFIASILMYLYH
jgi:hypothetical protein